MRRHYNIHGALGGGGAKVCHITKNLTKCGNAHPASGLEFYMFFGSSDVMCANEWEVNHCMFVEAFGTNLFPEITTRRKNN